MFLLILQERLSLPYQFALKTVLIRLYSYIGISQHLHHVADCHRDCYFPGKLYVPAPNVHVLHLLSSNSTRYTYTIAHIFICLHRRRRHISLHYICTCTHYSCTHIYMYLPVRTHIFHRQNYGAKGFCDPPPGGLHTINTGQRHISVNCCQCNSYNMFPHMKQHSPASAGSL